MNTEEQNKFVEEWLSLKDTYADNFKTTTKKLRELCENIIISSRCCSHNINTATFDPYHCTHSGADSIIGVENKTSLTLGILIEENGSIQVRTFRKSDTCNSQIRFIFNKEKVILFSTCDMDIWIELLIRTFFQTCEYKIHDLKCYNTRFDIAINMLEELDL